MTWKKADTSNAVYVDIAELAPWANIMIAACQDGPAILKVLSRAAFEPPGPQGMLFDLARESVIDQKALIQHLSQGEPASAGLDVLSDKANVPAAVVEMIHALQQPIRDSASAGTRIATGQLIVDNLGNYFAGKPLLTPVNA